VKLEAIDQMMMIRRVKYGTFP